MEKIILDMLTLNGVSLKKQNYIIEGGQSYEVGQPWRRAYVNSERGRQQVQNEIPEPYLTAIMTIWGDTPTVDETIE